MDRTKISGNNMDFLLGEEKSPAQMVAFLKEGALYRSFGETLSAVCREEPAAEKLVSGMAEITGENRESIARKVRNWMKGKNIPKSRETLYQICFALELDEAEASRVIGAAAETGIHYRSPDELVCAYGLRTGMKYQEMKNLQKKIRILYFSEEGDQKYQEPMKKAVFTRQVKEAFRQVTDEKELMDFFSEHSQELGELHETAYRKFTELLNCLQQPEGANGRPERKYTISEIMEDYFRMHVPETKRVAGYTLLQRLVKKYWPNESSLLNMKNRKEDVSRKAMILLYLVTEAFDEIEEEDLEDYYIDDIEEDPDTVLERRFQQMQLFLDTYGMNPLDPGNPFDFLVLYAMKTQDGEPVSQRMDKALDLLFSQPEQAEG